MSLDRPIFVVGVGRSGSTAFHDIFADHPRVAWLTALSNRFPAAPGLHRALMSAMDVPGIGPALRKRVRPSEAYAFWDHYARGFGRPCRDLRADDVSARNKKVLSRALDGFVTRKRDRLLVKITGWCRLGFLNEAFPDARFVHILRDGRAAANSILNVDWWDGYEGPTHWQWGELAPAYRDEWERHDRSFVALAAIQWKILMDAYEAAKPSIDPARLLEVRFEDFSADPLTTFRRVIDFCRLDSTPDFEARVRAYGVTDTNFKWREDLTPAQQVVLESVLASHLPRYGYT